MKAVHFHKAADIANKLIGSLHFDRENETPIMCGDLWLSFRKPTQPPAKTTPSPVVYDPYKWRKALRDLLDKVLQDKNGPEELVMMALTATDVLQQLVEQFPKRFKPIARKMTRWPVISSPVPTLRTPPQLIDCLEIGKEAPVEARPVTKIKPETLEYAIAVRLFESINDCSSMFSRTWRIHGEKVVLKAFSVENFDAWWKVAKAILLFCLPKIEEDPAFREMAIPPSKKRSPGRMRAAILGKIKGQFRALAKSSSLFHRRPA